MKQEDESLPQKEQAKILMKGRVDELMEKAVVADKTVVCKVQGSLVEAMVAYMAVNYVFMFEYPVGFNNFCLFLQKSILNISDGKKYPITLLNFINELDAIQ